MLDKLGGIYATRAGSGPHKRRESIPLTVLLRNRLHYAFSRQEAIKIVKDKEGLIKVDNKIRRDPRFPLGIMDVVSIEKTGEHFRILFDTKGRYQAHKIDAKEASFKLCTVKSKAMGENKVPYIVTHDGRTIRYPHPEIKRQDTIKVREAFLLLLRGVFSLFPLSLNNFYIKYTRNLYSLTSRTVKLKASSSTRTALRCSSSVETTSVESVSSNTSRSTHPASILLISRIATVTTSPPALATCS